MIHLKVKGSHEYPPANERTSDIHHNPLLGVDVVLLLSLHDVGLPKTFKSESFLWVVDVLN